ncbi:DUF350 domain-containing protein [Actinobacteria bacterium YIM 96077]|uniref:DUF350 domain-containing protein n=1 Tax=Phytoactinopolyspora halophila TaxID=1981511 RepID=A0A329QFF8_9ACTN|nr:DUF350 domain-containing protein [Phytoactinopolyspora halophila]AYY13085.1 DUF350 domain-containing protein [Actinobacteria bacterium YIM 96077]RAW11097.1 DUF350 domain-containing protein [Phytoactinopolyspora halophila]
MVTTLGIDGDLTAADLLEEVGIVLAYCGVGLLMILLGFILVDLLTPGRLRDLIWTERNHNAAVLVGTGFVAQGLIVIAAIWASADDFGEGLITTTAYSIVGLVVSTVVFLLVDLFTPSNLRRDLVHDEPHPGSWVVGTLRIVVSGIIALAIL